MLQSLTHIIISVFCFLFPLFFLPFTSDTHEYNKLILLLVTDSLLLFFFSLKLIRRKTLILVNSSFSFALLALLGCAALSTVFQSPNPFSALTTPLSLSSLLGTTIAYLLITQEINDMKERLLVFPLIAATGLVSIYTILMILGVLPFSIFTPAGNLLATATYLVVIAIYLAVSLYQKVYGRPDGAPALRWLFAGVLLLVLTALILLLRQIVTTHRPIVLPFVAGVKIAAAVLSHPRSLFLGVGTGNFLSAFTMEKPPAFNQSPFWNISFTSSSSYGLTLLTENGLPAILSFVTIFFLAVYRAVASARPASLALLAALLLQLVLPGNMTLSILTVILLILSAKRSPAEVHADGTMVFRFAAAICLLLTVTLSMYAIIRTYIAEVLFHQSLLALNAGSGKKAYDLQKRIIDLNPTLDRYHLAFSQTNLVLANALAAEASPSSDAKSLIPTFVAQSLQEGKVAVAGHPTNAANWIHLGSLYMGLIGFAEESDRWAVENYQKALTLDPNNPSIHLAIASVYQKVQKYDKSEQSIKEALRLKPDLIVAYMLLAQQQYKLGQADQARTTLETARTYADPGSQEYTIIEKELRKLP